MSRVPNPVLRRMLGAERPTPEFGHVTPPKALGLAVSQAAQQVLSLPMSVRSVDEARVSVAAMGELIPEAALAVVLTGGSAARGLAVLDPACLASVVEAQTRGRIDGPAPAPRPPTATDAMLSAAFLDRLLRGFAAGLAGHPAQESAAGLAPGERLLGPRLLPHVLPDAPYRAFRTELDIGGGTRSGALTLILPWEVTLPAAGADPGAADGAARQWSRALTERVMESEAGLEAVLCRVRLPLAEIVGWRPGQRVTIPARCIAEMALEGPDGEMAGLWRLGQADGMRAVRLVAAEGLARGQGARAPTPATPSPERHEEQPAE